MPLINLTFVCPQNSERMASQEGGEPPNGSQSDSRLKSKKPPSLVIAIPAPEEEERVEEGAETVNQVPLWPDLSILTPLYGNMFCTWKMAVDALMKAISIGEGRIGKPTFTVGSIVGLSAPDWKPFYWRGECYLPCLHTQYVMCLWALGQPYPNQPPQTSPTPTPQSTHASVARSLTTSYSIAKLRYALLTFLSLHFGLYK